MVSKKKSSGKKASKKTSKTKKKSPKKKTVKRGGTTTKRSTSKKRGTTRVKYESTKEIKVDKVLVDNFIALQKVMVNLSSKFDDLSKQISKLLDLFEISAKALAQKDTKNEKEKRDSEKIIGKLDDISQHAGLIGKGLALIHDINKEEGKQGFQTIRKDFEKSQPRPMPSPPISGQQKRIPLRGPPQRGSQPRAQQKSPPQGMQGYQRSISSEIKEESA